MNYETLTLAGGCFWCTEAVYQRLKGVISVIPGYAGGNVMNPTYEQVASGKTNHAEAIQIEYDPDQIRLEKILEVFWGTHDSTTLNRQGADVGTQYRSAIFYHNETQKEAAEKSRPVKAVTEIVPYSDFYPAEAYHKNYYLNHKNTPYCNLVITPKIQKLVKEFGKDVQ